MATYTSGRRIGACGEIRLDAAAKYSSEVERMREWREAEIKSGFWGRGRLSERRVGNGGFTYVRVCMYLPMQVLKAEAMASAGMQPCNVGSVGRSVLGAMAGFSMLIVGLSQRTYTKDPLS